MQHARILIAEKSRDDADKLCDTLKSETDFTIDVANTIESTRKRINEHGKDYFLAIVDLCVGGREYPELLDMAASEKIPTVVFTSRFDSRTRDHVLEHGALDYFVKGRHKVGMVVDFVRRLKANQSTKVLIVDDSATSRALLRSLLERHMFEVIEARDGVEGLETLGRNRDTRMVVTDYAMPEMDGYEFTKAIRKDFSPEDLAIIGLSAVGDRYLPAGFIKNGANDFLHKPFEHEEFFCRVLHNLENLDRIQRLRELSSIKDRFLGMAAHDLRNPINGIQSFTQLMLSGHTGELTQEQQEIVELLYRASSEMHQLVRDLLDVSAIESGKIDLEPVESDLPDLAKARVHVHRMAAKKKQIDIVLNADDLPLFNFDSRRIGQVMDNLLSNAIKFSPPDTTITMNLTLRNNKVVVEVADQGQGIPVDEISLLFSPFQKLSTRPTAGESSTGLGLAIVKKIVKAHYGSVWAQSTPGEGSSFFFSLPV